MKTYRQFKSEISNDHEKTYLQIESEAADLYAKHQVAAERERIKNKLRERITFWNSATYQREPKYSYKAIFELIDSL